MLQLFAENVNFHQVKSSLLYIVHTTQLLHVGNEWNLQQEVLALRNSTYDVTLNTIIGVCS
jgi:hypothetical protein